MYCLRCYATVAEVNGCDREQMDQEPKLFAAGPFVEKARRARPRQSGPGIWAPDHRILLPYTKVKRDTVRRES